MRDISFDSFAFPSCTACNTQFAVLESKVKPVLCALINTSALSSNDFNILFDWLDKVRIGLWLGWHYYLDHNYWGITPNYFINDRIGKADRALVIWKARDYYQGISFAGINTPAFAHVPSCFTFRVNKWFLLNISYYLIISKAVGLPYPNLIEYGGGNKINVSLSPSENNIEFPLIPLNYDRSTITIAQSVIPEQFYQQSDDFTYLTDHFKSINMDQHRTKPFIENNNSISIYPDQASTLWIPSPLLDFNTLMLNNAKETLRIQNQLIQRIQVSSKLSPEQKKNLELEFVNCVDANNKILSTIDK